MRTRLRTSSVLRTRLCWCVRSPDGACNHPRSALPVVCMQCSDIDRMPTSCAQEADVPAERQTPAAVHMQQWDEGASQRTTHDLLPWLLNDTGVKLLQ